MCETAGGSSDNRSAGQKSSVSADATVYRVARGCSHPRAAKISRHCKSAGGGGSLERCRAPAEAVLVAALAAPPVFSAASPPFLPSTLVLPVYFALGLLHHPPLSQPSLRASSSHPIARSSLHSDDPRPAMPRIVSRILAALLNYPLENTSPRRRLTFHRPFVISRSFLSFFRLSCPPFSGPRCFFLFAFFFRSFFSWSLVLLF